MQKLLIIDDEEKLRTLLSRILRLEGYQVLEAGTAAQGLKLLDREEPAVVLCDVKLPDANGVELIPSLLNGRAYLQVILLTAYGNIADGVQAIKNGAFDYITKGNDNEKIIPLVARAFEKVQLQQRIRDLEKQVSKKYSFAGIIGKSPEIKRAIELGKRVSGTDATVLLMGETGSGKEVFAQSVHYNSKRAQQPFVAINCSAFSRDLLESEIFGHKAGAFTGALKDKKGLIEEASTGTLFLDEIGEMPVELQAKLLRVLESKTFIKVGDTKTIEADVRIIAATNRQLETEVSEGRFREDLFYRLNVFTIILPSLNERREDIPLFVDFYMQQLGAKLGKNITGIDKQALQQLQAHNWKGNIRELKNVIERACILADTPVLTVDSLPFEFQHVPAPGNSGNGNFLSAFDLASVEKLHIQRVLNHTRGNKTEAAKLLNIGLTTLYRKIEEYHITL
ncbi:sigma-54-dependent transcriptional regulator [Deminuibacter soli]|uniref:Sigma-54-dependent Fis family transcriptional regulator n=1 Tax=Deminuibacter soli TaxID=2291815 RepID=A0A3E1NPX4_9BACT|nr:sigma-54 dependent transcriptional regulator [Deminuibacter soli]RFM29981.1 sigma-54-dependent Fis family transcriptional regulator [Deminuibacter soli]